MAGKRKAKLEPCQPKKEQCKSAAPSESQVEKTKKGSTIENAQNTFSSSPLGLLDIPPELRSIICRYAIVSDEPIKVQFKSNRRSGRSLFTMMPALTLVCKQLRFEARRLFFQENEFHVGPDILQQRGALPMLHNIHQHFGLELQSVYVSYAILRKCVGRFCEVEAKRSLKKVEFGRIAITKQAYDGKVFGRWAPSCNRSLIRHMDVCGCRVQKLVQDYNEKSSTHLLADFLQLLEQPGLGRRSYSTLGAPVVEEIAPEVIGCRDCGTPHRPFVLF